MAQSPGRMIRVSYFNIAALGGFFKRQRACDRKHNPTLNTGSKNSNSFWVFDV
jgi:hypothetical protein